MRFLSFKSFSISRPNASCIIWKVNSEPFAVTTVVAELDNAFGVIDIGAALVVGNEENVWDDNGDDAAIPPPLDAIK